MTAKSLPAREDTSDDHRNWIIKEAGDAILVPVADQAYDQYDMAVFVPWCGIVTNGVEAGDELTIRVTEGIQIDTDEIEAGSAFTAFGQAVYYNPATKLYTDTGDVGTYLVGYVIIPTDANGVMRFEKRRYVVAGTGS
jgi:hypothetical protein